MCGVHLYYIVFVKAYKGATYLDLCQLFSVLKKKYKSKASKMQIYSTTQVHWLTKLQMTAVVSKYIYNLYYLFPTCECLLDCIYFL